MGNGHAIYTARIRAGATGIDIQGLELLNMSVTGCAANEVCQMCGVHVRSKEMIKSHYGPIEKSFFPI
jgi:hypothetical protein